ncbi:MAG TPA: YjbQ family protein, partial [Nitrosopumilus sp.]|nr:YjbQ family protein [Nitrosopumilus sp.]
MKSLTEYLTFNVKTRRAFVNITSDIRKLVVKSKIQEGLCLVNAMHITS